MEPLPFSDELCIQPLRISETGCRSASSAPPRSLTSKSSDLGLLTNDPVKSRKAGRAEDEKL